uniref:Uncharacterized protein n=1 Tax=Plectus sambesii TaxID=2011161 RepID=A0A914VIT3_9BILA
MTVAIEGITTVTAVSMMVVIEEDIMMEAIEAITAMVTIEEGIMMEAIEAITAMVAIEEGIMMEAIEEEDIAMDIKFVILKTAMSNSKSLYSSLREPWFWPQSALKTHFAAPTVTALAVGTATIADAFVGMSIGIAAPMVIVLPVGPASTADAFVQEIAATVTEIALAEMSAFAVFVSSVVIDSSATPTATADQEMNVNAAAALSEAPDDAIVISTATGMKHAIMVVASSVVIRAIAVPIETAFVVTASLDAV